MKKSPRRPRSWERRIRDWVRSAVTAARARRPLVSVVVPIYNVEDYLGECLQSILRQPLRDMEIVLVDDGSTDSSGRIARRHARLAPRVRLIRQENAGLGAARNAGARAARGHLLAFVDSDDMLPADAYSVMVHTIQRTGSDIVVGKLMRDKDGQRSTMPLMRRNHERERLAITLEEMPEILADVFAVNKIFRRSFWDQAGLSFPERVRYEDQVALTKAFLAADHIDVLRETVYLWRIRLDKSSITQRRHEIDDLRDRLSTKQVSTDMVHAHHSLKVERIWWSTVLPADMPLYFRAVPGCTDEYWTELRDGMRRLWSQSPVPFVESRLPVQQRLMGWLVEHDRRQQLEQLVAFLDKRAGKWSVDVRGDRVFAVLPGLEDPGTGVPTEVFEFAEHELKWEARLLSAAWQPGRLRLEGFALIRNVPIEQRSTALSAELLGDYGTAEVTVTPRQEPRASSWVGNPGQDHDASGFTIEVKLAALLSSRGGKHDDVSRWSISMRRRVEQLEREGSFTTWVGSLIDHEWRPVGDHASARLAVVDGELVLELRSR